MASREFPGLVFDVAQFWSPNVIGAALAKLWVIDGQKLAPLVYISGDVECPITLDKMENPALLCDGTVYEEVAISRWLQNKNTVPCTNLPLEHRHILRLKSLKAVMEHFLCQNEMLNSCAETKLEHSIRRAKMNDKDTGAQEKKLENLAADISSATQQMQRLRVLIFRAKATAKELNASINARKLACATKLQAVVRGFLVRVKAAKLRNFLEMASNSRVTRNSCTTPVRKPVQTVHCSPRTYANGTEPVAQTSAAFAYPGFVPPTSSTPTLPGTYEALLDWRREAFVSDYYYPVPMAVAPTAPHTQTMHVAPEMYAAPRTSYAQPSSAAPLTTSYSQDTLSTRDNNGLPWYEDTVPVYTAPTALPQVPTAPLPPVYVAPTASYPQPPTYGANPYSENSDVGSNNGLPWYEDIYSHRLPRTAPSRASLQRTSVA